MRPETMYLHAGWERIIADPGHDIVNSHIIKAQYIEKM